jgi:hypothetical protein
MKTIKVRIPAVVSPDGKWCAYGYPSAEVDPDWPMLEETADNGEPCFEYKRVWITVDLPVPDVTEVTGAAVE